MHLINVSVLKFLQVTVVTSIRKTSYLQEEIFLTEALWQHEEGGYHSALQVCHQSSTKFCILTLYQHFYLWEHIKTYINSCTIK